jgi:squalene-hopene/tetraprenyl-beta-curcumene cyclase
MKYRSRHVVCGLCMLAFVIPPAQGAPAKNDETTAKLVSSRPAAVTLDESVRHEVEAAIDRALDWLATKQKDDGSWSDPSFPALSALPLWSFALSKHQQKNRVMPLAVKHILSCVRDNGGIYRNVEGRPGGGLSNYNTAICMTALHMTGDKALTPVVLKARKFIADSQHFGDDIYDGGMGYDKSTGRAYADLLNTVIAAEGMRLTESAEDLRPAGEKKADLNWAKTREFLARLQNKKDTGKDQAGGFPYRPDQSKAGTITNAAGKVVFRSYGSMTYAGLLALIYADVDRDDPRVRSAFDWARKHWNLDENPGMGPQGLFYFYHVLTKSLSAYGEDRIDAGKAGAVDWRSEVAQKLVSLQKIDAGTGHGYWENDEGRFWEKNPVLTTAYSTLALQILLGQ